MHESHGGARRIGDGAVVRGFDRALGDGRRLEPVDQPHRDVVVRLDHLAVEPFHRDPERRVGHVVRHVLREHHAVPPQGGGGPAAGHRRGSGSHLHLADDLALTLFVHGAGAARPQVGDRDLALLELLLDVGGIRDQVLGVHVRGEALHHLERRETLLVVDGRPVGAVEEGAAHAEVHVHELLGEVPAGLVGAPEWVLDHPRLPDRLRRGQDLVPGRRHRDAEVAEDVVAVHEVLRVHHHRDGHGLAVDPDELVRPQVLAVLRHQVVDGPDGALVQQGNHGGVRDAADLVQRGIRLQRGRLLVAEFLIQLGFEVAALGHRLGGRLPGREPGREHLDRSLVLEGASGPGARREQRDGPRQRNSLQHLSFSLWSPGLSVTASCSQGPSVAASIHPPRPVVLRCVGRR